MWCSLFFRDCWIRSTYGHYKGLLWVTERRGQYQREHSHFKRTNHCVGQGPFSLESQICVLTSRWRRFDSPDGRNVEPMRGGQKRGSKRYSDIRMKSNFRKRGAMISVWARTRICQVFLLSSSQSSSFWTWTHRSIRSGQICKSQTVCWDSYLHTDHAPDLVYLVNGGGSVWVFRFRLL